MAKRIPLTRGKFAIVDDDMFLVLNQWKWCADITRHTWYAHRCVYLGGGRANCKLKKIKMHRFILGMPTGSGGVVDHINGDGLDNRKENLRKCTQSDNIQSGPHRKNPIGYLGVRSVLESKIFPYASRISDNGVRLHLGVFKTAEEAARAYDAAALRIHGKHARTNFGVSWRS